MMANGYIHGVSGSKLANTKSVHSGRYETTVHELGHLFGPIGDEYSKSVLNGLNRRRPNTVVWWKRVDGVWGAYIPPLGGDEHEMKIEWAHWILGPEELCPNTKILDLDNPQHTCPAGNVIYCPEGEGEGICSIDYCNDHPNQPCLTPLPTDGNANNQYSPVGLYYGGSYRKYGFRTQPHCIMRNASVADYYCRPCREQLIVDINHEIQNQIFDAEVCLNGSILTCRAKTRKPLTHSLVVEWSVDPEEEGNCEVCPSEGECEGEWEVTQGTEEHICCFDTSTWNKPAQYTITLKVTDYANPGDADLDDYENRWVKDEYEFADEDSKTVYSFSNDMVFYKTGDDVWTFVIEIN